MADNFCKSELMKATQSVLAREDIDELIKDVQNRAKSRAQLKGEDQDTAIKNALNDRMEEMRQVDKEKKIAAYQNLLKKQKIEAYLERFSTQHKALTAKVAGVQSNIVESAYSTAAKQMVRKYQLLTRLSQLLQKSDVLKDFNSRANELSLVRALWDPEADVSPAIRNVANAIKDTYRVGIKLLNKNGANIRELTEYIAKQAHNPVKMLHAGDTLVINARLRIRLMQEEKGNYPVVAQKLRTLAFQRWKTFILPRLDATRTFEGAPPDEFLQNTYDGLTSGIHKKGGLKEDQALTFKRPGSLAEKASAERILHFKDADSWYEYQQKYGYGSVHDLIGQGLESTGRKIALLEDWGTNPEAMFNTISKNVLEKERTIPRIKWKLWKTGNMFKELTGETSIMGDSLTGKILMGFRVLNPFRLGGLLLNSIPDYATKASVYREAGGNYLEPFADGINDFIRGKTSKELRRIGDELGVWTDSTIGNSLTRFGSLDTPRGIISKLEQQFFKLTLITRHDFAMETGTAIWLSRHIANLRDTSFENLDPLFQRNLRIYGIDSKEWDLIHSNPESLRIVENKLFVTPQMMSELAPADIAKYLGKDESALTPEDSENVKDEMDQRLRVFFIDQANNALTRAGAHERGLVNMGTRPGTINGEILRIIFQFKSFGLALTRRTLGRFIYGHGADNLYQAFVEGKADVRGLAHFALNGLALGYISMAARNLSNGINPPDPLKINTWAQAGVQGLGFWIVNDFIGGEANRYGSTFLNTFGGPGVQNINQTRRIVDAILSLQNPLPAMGHLLKSNTPMLNLFYTKLAVEHLILYGAKEKMDPGSLEKLQQRIEKENPNGTWWPATAHNFTF